MLLLLLLLLFKAILVITLTVITACFSEYKYSVVLYSSGSDVSVHWSSRSTRGRRKTVLIFISSKYRLRKPAKIIFNTTVMALFSKLVHKGHVTARWQ